MKRLLCLLLCSFLLPLAPAGAAAGEGDFLYKLIGHGRAAITGYTGNEMEVIVPADILGHPVTAIGEGAFMGKTEILSVSLPEGLTAIGDNAFSGCTGLIAVNLPATLKEIGEFAFSGCLSLPGIELPAGVGVIRNKTFAACESLRRIVLPPTLKTIGGAAFAASGLESIDFPRSLREIGPDAFAACPNLVALRIPGGVSKIGRLAFGGCTSLESVVLPASLSTLNALFSGCSSLRSAAIPGSVKSIAATGTFAGCLQVSILGFKGSAAEKYAKKQAIPFVAVEPVSRVSITSGGADIAGGTLTIDLSSGAGSLQLMASTWPENPWPGVLWRSSAPGIAQVSADGIVRGLKAGKATITASALDGSGQKAACHIAVTDSAH
ncbi:MAG: leucine-rich repeat protein [Christensenellales bacterium]